MTPAEMEQRIVRHGHLRPCRSAFIDAHTPGSNEKENFTIIGAGVAENPDQYVHIRETPGFNIGAAGQPPKCRNSLHSHHTAEVFFVLKGRWRFFWGRWGDAGEVVLEEGDLFNIPTGIFRGFENIGADYGMIMAVLGGDDSGGGVVWAPQVIEDAKGHGLILGENGVLYNTTNGEQMPDNIKPMPLLNDEQLKAFPEPKSREVIPNYVARYWDMMSLAQSQPAKIIGPDAMLRDRPGFEMDFVTRGSLADEFYETSRHEILMVMRGHWKLSWDEGEKVLDPGDTCAVPPGIRRKLTPAQTGEASLFRVRNTDDPPGQTWRPAS